MAAPDDPLAAAAVNPYAAPSAQVLVEGAGDAEPAARGQRLRAAIIDYLVFVVPLAVVVGVASGLTASGRPGLSVFGMVAGLATFLAIVGWNAVLLARHGQTVGKKASGIRIVRNDGSDASFARLFFLRGAVNWLIASIPWVGGLYALVDTLFIFRADRRCIHDLLADTRVVLAQS
ncbi:MAG: RDD family protein [Burkholderiales bacterium]|nr:RDD family protein [Burkholderiales bacterium]